MSVRMWRKNGPILSVEGKKGYFDVAYGGESDAQKLDVWLPEGTGPFPAIISIHGGGYIACDKRQKEMIDPMLRGLSKGFAVIGVNYRLSGEAKFPAAVKDVRQAVRFIKAHADQWGILPDQLTAWGGSAGGYLTLMCCLCAEEPYFDNPDDPNLALSAGVAAGVAWYPQVEFANSDEELEINSIRNHFLRKKITDINEAEYEPAFPVREESQFPMHNLAESACSMFLGCTVNSGDEIVKKAGAINYIHKNMAPVFLQHGSDDEILPAQQSIRFAIRANAVCREERVIFEMLPGAIHSSVLFETEENLEKVFTFIRQAVGV